MDTIKKDEKMIELDAYMQSLKGKDRPESQLIAILHKAQGLYGYLSKEVMNHIAETMDIPTAHIWGVATFYHYFNLVKPGKYVVSVCLGTACYVKGAGEVLQTLKDELKIGVGETTKDGLFTLQEARCLGACGLAPVMMVDDKIYGDLTPRRVTEVIRNYRKAVDKK